MNNFLTPLILSFFVVNTSQAAELIAGPMIGHTTPYSAKIWIETDAPATVQINYMVNTSNYYARPWKFTPMEKGSAQAETTKEFPYIAVVELTDLKPRSEVRYDVLIEGRTIRPLNPQVFYPMPIETENVENGTEFMVAFSSCMYPSWVPHQPIWHKALQFRPSAFLYIGDMNYMPQKKSEYETDLETIRYSMAAYHREVRQLPGVRALMATTPSYGIWDDHDFGPNNSDRTFGWRDEALKMYNSYWPNVEPHDKGVYHSFKIADAEFFMLDNRFHRDPNDAEDRSTMFGEDQMNWLRTSLQASDATFKIIASGGTIATNRGENWANFGTERDDFLKWLFKEKITGVVFIAGDWHVGTLNRLYRPQDDYPLYELISSNSGVRKEPINRDVATGSGGNHHSASNTYRGYNFGALWFSGKPGERMITLQIIDESGEAQIHRQLTEKDLRPAGRYEPGT